MEDIDPNTHKNNGLRRVFKALFYSFDGIISALKHEAAFGQEVILAAVLLPLSFLMGLTLVEHLILVASIFLVLIVELLNSAIEAVVDDISLSKRPLAKRAKDMGSAAVLLSLLNCFFCWLAVIIVNWSRFFCSAAPPGLGCHLQTSRFVVSRIWLAVATALNSRFDLGRSTFSVRP